MKNVITTIMRYDSERGTTAHEERATLYTFDELPEASQLRVVREFIEDREQWAGQEFADFQEHEIWQCVRDLEESITGARVEWRYNRWYSCDFDCEYSYSDCYDPGYMEPVKDNGYYASVDICDAWNAHARKLNGLYRQFEYLDYLCWDVYNDWDAYAQRFTPEAKFYNRADELRSLIIGRWFEELEKACDDVQNVIETLLRVEWEDFTSEEYAREQCADESTQGGECRTCEYPYWNNGGYTGRVFYSDCRKWYTVDGEFYEQSNVNHQCISIVKAS